MRYFNEQEIKIVKDLLRKFYRHGVWGRHHWRENTVPKGFPAHLKKKVMDIAEELRKEGFLIKRPSAHGAQWYANIERLEEIKELIKN